ncbi:Nitrogen permease regulator 3 [Malassezia yamatoensis]|uniref:Nitrogen permease regulator 3 n=1 Tax=Malassezia yamatoensis TaxID=253288 RepID=A0AAJ5YSN1_9BASI|nr:Nitrogen permease regulator 3 [Malassezia yamatoensis]
MTASPLVALLLVTSSSRGSHVVFQWPRKPKVIKNSMRMRYYAAEEDPPSDFQAADAMTDPYFESSSSDDSQSEATDSDSSEASFQQNAALFGKDEENRSLRERTSTNQGHTRRESGSERARGTSRSWDTPPISRSRPERADDETKRAKSFNTYLGFDLELLAAILSPKREQCHHKFELVIDGLVFLGHPVYFEKDQRWKLDSHNLTEFNLVMVIDRPDTLPALPGTDSSIWTQLYYTLLFKMTAVLYAEQLKSAYVSEQINELLNLRDTFFQEGDWFQDYLYAALERSSLARMIKEAQRAIAHSRDTVICINDSVELHLQLPQLLLEPGQAPKVGELQRVLDAQDPVVQRGDGPEPRDPLRTLSSLGALPGSAVEQTLQDWTRTTGPFLQPWKTLLLSEASMDMIDQDDTIFEFARPLLKCFTPSLRGSRTFSQAAETLHWDLYKEVYPMVRHVIYYAEARVIDPPRIQGTYAMDPTFVMERLPLLDVSWSTSFPMMRCLAQFLADLSANMKPYIAHFAPRINHTLCLDTLVWLLRNSVVVPIHEHVRLIITAENQQLAYELRERRMEQRAQRHNSSDSDQEILIDSLRTQMQRGTNVPERPSRSHRAMQRSRSKSSSSDSSGDEWKANERISAVPPLVRTSSRHRSQSFFSAEDDPNSDDQDEALNDLLPEGGPTSVLVLEPSRATRRENEWISAMLHGKHSWYTRWFLRLLPYLNGKHTLEEILARERLRRRDLKQILSQFESNLLIFSHP